MSTSLPEEPAAPLVPHRAVLRDLLFIAAAAAGLWVIHQLGRLIIVLVLAMFFAYVIAPLVELAQHPIHRRGRTHRLGRVAAIGVVYLLLAGVAGAGVAILWPRAAAQVDAAIANAPQYTTSFHAWERGWTRYYDRLRIPIELRHSIDESVVGAGEAVAVHARGSLVTLAGMLTEIPWLVLIPVLAFLLLKDGALIRRTLLVALPHRVQLRCHRLFEEMNATLAAYIRAQLIACVLVGTVCGAGFALLGNPYAVLLGLLAGVLEFIPLIGPLVVAIVAVTVATFHDPASAVRTAMFLVVLRGVEDYVVYPRLIGRHIHLHSLAVIVAVLAGAELGGIAGVFVAVPVLALVTVGVRHFLAWRCRDTDKLDLP